MSISIDCADCGHHFSVRDEYAGKRGRCPSCKAEFRAPAEPDADDDMFVGGGFTNGASRGAAATSPASRPAAGKKRAKSSKGSMLPTSGWIAIGGLLLCACGTLSAAWTLAPSAAEYKVEAKDRAKKSVAASEQVTKDVTEKVEAVATTLKPVAGQITEFVRPKSIEEDITPAIVKVINLRNGQPQGSGTGWFFKVDDKLLVATNHHVVNQCSELQIEMSDESKFDIDGFIATSTNWDLCILKPRQDIPRAKPLRISRERLAVKPGDTVFAAGNPGSHRHTITRGIVSRSLTMRQIVLEGAKTDSPWLYLNRDEDIMFIEHDARIWPGNSGGPLFNDRFEVIGVNSRSEMMMIPTAGKSRRGPPFRLVPTFGLASDSAYIWKMIEENKTGTVRPLNELPKMDMH